VDVSGVVVWYVQIQPDGDHAGDPVWTPITLEPNPSIGGAALVSSPRGDDVLLTAPVRHIDWGPDNYLETPMRVALPSVTLRGVTTSFVPREEYWSGLAVWVAPPMQTPAGWRTGRFGTVGAFTRGQSPFRLVWPAGPDAGVSIGVGDTTLSSVAVRVQTR